MDENLANLFATDVERFAIEYRTYADVPNHGLEYNEIEDYDDYTWRRESTEGGEGDGAEMWVIFAVTQRSTGIKKLLRYEGYYSSWDSSEFDTRPTEVFAKQVIRDEYLSRHEMAALAERLV